MSCFLFNMKSATFGGHDRMAWRSCIDATCFWCHRGWTDGVCEIGAFVWSSRPWSPPELRSMPWFHLHTWWILHTDIAGFLCLPGERVQLVLSHLVRRCFPIPKIINQQREWYSRYRISLHRVHLGHRVYTVQAARKNRSIPLPYTTGVAAQSWLHSTPSPSPHRIRSKCSSVCLFGVWAKPWTGGLIAVPLPIGGRSASACSGA